jgi:hypothetical protein
VERRGEGRQEQRSYFIALEMTTFEEEEEEVDPFEAQSAVVLSVTFGRIVMDVGTDHQQAEKITSMAESCKNLGKRA